MAETNRKHRKLFSMLLTLALTVTMAFGTSVSAYAADKDIVILFTNDVHCSVDDNLGYAGLALYEKQVREETPYVILADAGDAIQGAPIGTLSEGGYITDIMNRVGYDFAIPGNHEFDYGMKRFLELAGSLDCGYYSSNFMDLQTGSRVFAPYKLFEFGGTKLALVGVTTPESFTKSTPAYFQDANGNYIYGFSEGGSGQELYSQVQSAVDEARGQGAEYVILVGHLGQNGVTPEWSSTAVLANTTGIDACIDGHSHETYYSYTGNKNGKQVLLAQTGTKLSQIGKLTIRADGTLTAEAISQVAPSDAQGSYTVQNGDSLSRIAKRELGSYNRWAEIYAANQGLIQNPDLIRPGMVLALPGSSGVTEDGKAFDYATDQYIKKIQAQFAETLKTVIGHTDVELTVNHPETGERAVRSAETNLGDLAADAYRNVLGADIGFANGGGVRASIARGNITYNDALTVFPFGNMGCVVEASGQQIKYALEMAARNCPEENGGFLQVSGLTYTIDTTIPSSVQVDEKGNFLGVNGAYRVSDIMVGTEALDTAKTYTLASHNYMLKSGGDGFTMFTGCKVLKDEIISDMDLLSQYIRVNLNGNVGSDYADPAGQGRIRIIK